MATHEQSKQSFSSAQEIITHGYKQLAELNHYIATHDGLTGLANRLGLQEALDLNQPPIAALVIDGDNQKAVNDHAGYARGNETIIGTAETIRQSLRPYDFVARVGGDEFLALLFQEPDESPDSAHQRQGNLTPEEQVKATIGRIEQATTQYLQANPDLEQYGFGISVGGAVWHEGQGVGALMQEAEQNMKLYKTQQHQQNGQYRVS